MKYKWTCIFFAVSVISITFSSFLFSVCFMSGESLCIFPQKLLQILGYPLLILKSFGISAATISIDGVSYVYNYTFFVVFIWSLLGFTLDYLLNRLKSRKTYLLILICFFLLIIVSDLIITNYNVLLSNKKVEESRARILDSIKINVYKPDFLPPGLIFNEVRLREDFDRDNRDGVVMTLKSRYGSTRDEIEIFQFSINDGPKEFNPPDNCLGGAHDNVGHYFLNPNRDYNCRQMGVSESNTPIFKQQTTDDISNYGISNYFSIQNGTLITFIIYSHHFYTYNINEVHILKILDSFSKMSREELYEAFDWERSHETRKKTSFLDSLL